MDKKQTLEQYLDELLFESARDATEDGRKYYPKIRMIYRLYYGLDEVENEQ